MKKESLKSDHRPVSAALRLDYLQRLPTSDEHGSKFKCHSQATPPTDKVTSERFGQGVVSIPSTLRKTKSLADIAGTLHQGNKSPITFVISDDSSDDERCSLEQRCDLVKVKDAVEFLHGVESQGQQGREFDASYESEFREPLRTRMKTRPQKNSSDLGASEIQESQNTSNCNDILNGPLVSDKFLGTLPNSEYVESIVEFYRPCNDTLGPSLYALNTGPCGNFIIDTSLLDDLDTSHELTDDFGKKCCTKDQPELFEYLTRAETSKIPDKSASDKSSDNLVECLTLKIQQQKESSKELHKDILTSQKSAEILTATSTLHCTISCEEPSHFHHSSGAILTNSKGDRANLNQSYYAVLSQLHSCNAGQCTSFSDESSILDNVDTSREMTNDVRKWYSNNDSQLDLFDSFCYTPTTLTEPTPALISTDPKNSLTDDKNQVENISESFYVSLASMSLADRLRSRISDPSKLKVLNNLAPPEKKTYWDS